MGLRTRFRANPVCEPIVHAQKILEILTNLRLKTCFQQVGQVLARKLQNVKTLGANFALILLGTFAILRTEIMPVK